MNKDVETLLKWAYRKGYGNGYVDGLDGEDGDDRTGEAVLELLDELCIVGDGEAVILAALALEGGAA